MKSEAILFENYREKRNRKFEGFDAVVTKKDLYSLVGNYTFDNFGVSYVDLSDCDFTELNLKDMSKICFSSSTVRRKISSCAPAIFSSRTEIFAIELS